MPPELNRWHVPDTLVIIIPTAVAVAAIACLGTWLKLRRRDRS